MLDFARQCGVKVIHVVHEAGSGAKIFDSDGAGVQIIDILAPKDNETIAYKKFPNSFHQTNLFSEVQATGKKQLVIVGFASHMCSCYNHYCC